MVRTPGLQLVSQKYRRPRLVIGILSGDSLVGLRS